MFSNFNNLPSDQYWKFFTDFNQWKNGQDVFDKQDSPGYFQHCSIALFWMLHTLNKPVDLNYILTLKNLAYHSDPTKDRGLALEVESGIGSSSITEAGVQQLIAQAPETAGLALNLHFGNSGITTYQLNQEKDAQFIFNQIVPYIEAKDRVGLSRKSNSVEEVAEGVTSRLTAYKEEINLAKVEEQKLTAIVKVIQNLHQFHPFPDGNGRTFCFFLLNKLLLENDLAPTIIEDPGYFTGCSVTELVEAVKVGQKRFQSLCHPLEISLVDMIRKEINLTPKEEQELFIDPVEQVENKKLFRLLQWYGFENDKTLVTASLKNDSRQARDLLRTLHASAFAKDPHWRRLVVHMIENKKTDALKSLKQVIDAADDIKDQPWFKTEKYIDMVLTSPEYGTFDKINEKYLDRKKHFKAAWSNKSLALIEKYIYQAPASLNKLFEVIDEFQHDQSSSCYYRYILVGVNNESHVGKDIQLYLFEGQVWYRTTYQGELTCFNLEAGLKAKIEPKQLEELKTLIQSEVENLVKDLACSKSNCQKQKPVSFHTKLTLINANLPEILRELAENTQHPALLASAKHCHLECENVLTPQKYSKTLGELQSCASLFFQKNPSVNSGLLPSTIFKK
jgi:hypothetical protein